MNPLSNELVKEAEQIFESWFNTYSVPVAEIEDFDISKSGTFDRYMTKQTALLFL